MAGIVGDVLEVAWLETASEDAPDFCRALIDLAVTMGADRVQLMLPSVNWLTAAARRAGCELEPMTIYAVGL